MAVMPPQAVLHLELATGLERISVYLETGFEIVRVDALGPAVTQFPLQGSPGEVEPALVEERATRVEPRHPHEDRRTIGEGSEAIVDLIHTATPGHSVSRTGPN